MKGLSNDFGYPHDIIEIFCDSKTAIAFARKNVYHERTKHNATKMHFICNKIEDSEVQVSKVHTSENPADLLTKVLPVNTFK